MKKKDKNFSFRISEELLEELNNVSKMTGIPMSVIIRKAIDTHMEKLRKLKGMM